VGVLCVLRRCGRRLAQLRVVWKSFHAPTKAARIRLVENFSADLKRGAVQVADRTITVAALIEQFPAHLDTRVGSADPKHRIAPKTRRHYEQRLDADVLPLLGRRKLADLTVVDLRNLIDEMRKRGHSPSTSTGSLTAFAAALRFAMKRNLTRWRTCA
jgi:integrase-like protein